MKKYILFNPKGLCETYTINGKTFTLRKAEMVESDCAPDSCTPGIRITETEVPEEKPKKKKTQESSEG